MKLTPFFLVVLSAYLFSCNDAERATTERGDSTAVIPDPEAKPGRGPAGMIEFPLGDSAALEKYLHKTYQKSYFRPNQVMKVEMLARQYTPKEVFLEILRRTGRMKNDTTIIPRAFRKNYGGAEIKGIILKNLPLHQLEFNDAMSLYERVAQLYDVNVIYDSDDREEVVYNYGDLSNPNPMRADMCNAKSVAAVIASYQLTDTPIGFRTLVNYPRFGDNFTYCGKEVFLKQPAAAKCTAFVYDSVTLITTAHDLNEISIKRYSFVFDYIIDPKQGARTVFPESCVYKAKSARFVKTGNMDICIITLDRKLDPRRVPIFSSKAIGKNDSFYVIGCPVGIPLKLAGKVSVLDNANPDFFMVKSDTYQGNSGSPFFNARTHQIEGYLVEGEKDFGGLKDVICSKVITCGEDGCSGSKGEKVIRTSYFIQLLKK